MKYLTLPSSWWHYFSPLLRMVASNGLCYYNGYLDETRRSSRILKDEPDWFERRHHHLPLLERLRDRGLHECIIHVEIL